MELTWYGLSCFRMAERGKTTVMTDPYSPALGIEPTGTTRSDVVTISHDAPGHNAQEVIKGDFYALTTPGEYEIGGTFITGIPLHTVQDELIRYNVGYLVNMDGLKILHLGDLSYIPDQSVVEGFGEVNVLLLPVGGGHSLSAPMAAEVVSLIEPNYIVPMHYALPGIALELDPIDRFLKAMGVSTVQEQDTLKVTPSGLPEQPEVVLLTPNMQAL
jgi:L-ascorbate metabolism protein UlaG (beta-lactamase superfamily)